MRHTIKTLLAGMLVGVLVLTATGAHADTYGTVLEELMSMEPDQIMLANDTVQGLPDSDMRNLFLAATTVLAGIADTDASASSISNKLNEYGLQFGQTIGQLEPIVSSGVNTFDTSTKSLDDLKDFVASWKALFPTGIGYLANIPTSFSQTVTLPSGDVVEIDYTDVLALKSALQMGYALATYLSAFNMDVSVQDLDSPTKLSNLLAGDTFLQLVSGGTDLLDLAKQWAYYGALNYRSTLEALEAEPSPGTNILELFDLDADDVADQLWAVKKLISGLNNDTEVDLQDDAFSLFNPNVLFDGTLSIADMAAQGMPTSESYIVFDTTGHKLGDDPTLNGLFPNVTQTDWDKWYVSNLGMFMFMEKWGQGVPAGDAETTNSGQYYGTVNFTAKWTPETVYLSSWDKGVYVNSSDFYLEAMVTGWDSYSTVTQSYSVSDGVYVFRFQANGKTVDIILTEDGDISMSCDSDTTETVELSYYDFVDDVYKRINYDLDPAAEDTASLFLSQSGNDLPVFGASLGPILEMLLTD